MTVEFDTPCMPGDDEWHRRLALFLADDGPIEWHWLSFINTDLPYLESEDYPGGYRHLGVCIIPAPNVVAAADLARVMGCNPGGAVRSYPACPSGWRPKPEYVAKLFSGDEARALGQLELDELCDPLAGAVSTEEQP